MEQLFRIESIIHFVRNLFPLGNSYASFYDAFKILSIDLNVQVATPEVS